MSSKLPAQHHFEFLRLKTGCTGSSESTLVNCQNDHMSSLSTQARYSNNRQYAIVMPPIVRWTAYMACLYSIHCILMRLV